MLKCATEKYTSNAREVILQRFTWEHIVQKWIKYVHQAGPPKWEWNSPVRQYGMPPVTGELTITQFIHALSQHVPHLDWSLMNLNSIKAMNMTMELKGKQMVPVTPKMVAGRYQGMIENINMCEQVRTGHKELPKEDYLT